MMEVQDLPSQVEESCSSSVTLKDDLPSKTYVAKQSCMDQKVSDSSTSDSEKCDSDSDIEDDSQSDNDPSVAVPDARKFCSSKYERMYSWLYYNVSRHGYCCKICEIFCPYLLHNKQENPFVTGVHGLGAHPTRKLNGHANSKTHLEAVKKKDAALSYDHNVCRLLSNQEDKEVTQNRRYLTMVIQSIVFVVQQHWALDRVSNVMDHMTEIGNDKTLIEYTRRHPKVKYTSSQSVSEIITLISDVIEEEILNKLRNAEAFTLLADESSDTANREQFAIIVRFPGKESVEEHFLGIVVVKRTDAESLMKAIESFLLAKGIDIGRAVFVGFDGCNVMSGENKGLQRRFRHYAPHQVYINCRNHKLALCVKHLIKQFPIVDKVDSMLLAVWKLFHYSPRKFATLQEVQDTYRLCKLQLIKASTTRWLSHGRACVRLVERFVQVIDALDACLDEKYEPEVYGIREQLLDKNTMAAVLILCDLLAPVIRFSDYLQGRVIFSDVTSRCKGLIDELTQLIARFQSCLQTPDGGLYIDRLTEIFAEIDDRSNLARRIRQHQVFTAQQIIHEVAIPVTYGLINEITDAFHCAPVLDSFSVFRVANVPDSMADMATYGENEIGILANHYGQPKVDVFKGHRTVAEPRFAEAEIRNQWVQFRPQLSLIKQKRGDDEGLGDLDDKVEKLFHDPAYKNSFPAVNYLYQLHMLIPTSTACVERLFSLMNLLCTPHRNRLGQATLDGLIRICLRKDKLTDSQLNKVIQRFAAKERGVNF